MTLVAATFALDGRPAMFCDTCYEVGSTFYTSGKVRRHVGWMWGVASDGPGCGELDSRLFSLPAEPKDEAAALRKALRGWPAELKDADVCALVVRPNRVWLVCPPADVDRLVCAPGVDAVAIGSGAQAFLGAFAACPPNRLVGSVARARLAANVACSIAPGCRPPVLGFEP